MRTLRVHGPVCIYSRTYSMRNCRETSESNRNTLASLDLHQPHGSCVQVEFAAKQNSRNNPSQSRQPRTMADAGDATRPLRVWLLHPDLGLGGAEKLVVNAALSLQARGHQVKIITAHHDPARCFSETLPGGPLGECVQVHGDWLPRAVFGRFHVVCAILRMLVVATVAATQCFSGAGPDVFVVDQVAHVVPFLRLFARRPVVFYCHFPDKLLCVDRTSRLKRFYRAPMDWWEEVSTGASDAVIVNSEFTAEIFRSAFTSLSRVALRVLYPCIDMAQFDEPLTAAVREKAQNDFPPGLVAHLKRWGEDAVLLVSINRFERKKNLLLAIEALARLPDHLDAAMLAPVHLILAGGYDPRLPENVEYFAELEKAAHNLPEPLSGKVSFLRSFTDTQRVELLRLARCVVYTPDREHFGIVPVEAMYAGCPVVAVASGGPLESIDDAKTGFLVDQTPDAFAAPLAALIQDPRRAKAMGADGRTSAARRFSLETFGKGLDEILREAIATAGVSRYLFVLALATGSIFAIVLALLW